MTTDRERSFNTVRGMTARIGPLENPLDFIAEDHMREREVCALIDKLVAALPLKTGEKQMITSFLTDRLPHHLADEEIDLFPLMLERCDPDEDIRSVIDKLESDHSHAIADAPTIASLVEASGSEASAFTASSRVHMAEFAKQARRHLILENAIILPIARSRLTTDDLAIMRSHMLQRRSPDRAQEGAPC